MIDHDEIMKLKISQFKNGDVTASSDNFATFKLVWPAKAVRPDYVNLLRASAKMYQQLQLNVQAFEAVERLAEASKQDQLAHSAMTFAAATKMTMLCAIDQDYISDQINKNRGKRSD